MVSHPIVYLICGYDFNNKKRTGEIQAFSLCHDLNDAQRGLRNFFLADYDAWIMQYGPVGKKRITLAYPIK